jgi:hypothetical protein
VSYLPILFYFFHFHWGLNEYADCRTSMWCIRVISQTSSDYRTSID